MHSHYSQQGIPCSVVAILIEAPNSVENGCPIISVGKKKPSIKNATVTDPC